MRDTGPETQGGPENEGNMPSVPLACVLDF